MPDELICTTSSLPRISLVRRRSSWIATATNCEQIEEQIRRFELAEFIDELAENYSHGMKQRVAFAAALLHDPPVVIVDEPMVGLDPRSARLVKNLLKELAVPAKVC